MTVAKWLPDLKRRLVPLLAMTVLPFAGCDFGGTDLLPGVRKDMLGRVNDARSDSRPCGERRFDAAPDVVWNDLLAQAALRHANDVTKNGLAGHTGSDFSGPMDRLRDTGYAFEAVGEILATGSLTPGEVMDAFIDSPGHCSVLMGSQFTEVGAAMAGGRAWTIMFASPKNP